MKNSMRCPQCDELNQESMTFPEKNIESSQKFEPFYDEHGRKITIQQVALSYACTYGHVFKLADSNSISSNNGRTKDLPAMQAQIPMRG